MSEEGALQVGKVLDVEKTALLIHGLTASPDVPVTAPALAFLVLCYEAPPNLWALLSTVTRLAGPRGAVRSPFF